MKANEYRRGYHDGLREANRFFLLHEADRARCHAAGRHLAEVVQRGYAEGETAPGVMVRYVECPLAVA